MEKTSLRASARTSKSLSTQHSALGPCVDSGTKAPRHKATKAFSIQHSAFSIRKRSLLALAIAAAGVGSLFSAAQAKAATYFWSGAANSIWDLNSTQDWGTATGGPYNAAKWTDFSTFGTDTAQFEGTAGTVTLAANLSAYGLTFTPTAGGYTIIGNQTLTLGSGGINASAQTSGSPQTGHRS